VQKVNFFFTNAAGGQEPCLQRSIYNDRKQSQTRALYTRLILEKGNKLGVRAERVLMPAGRSMAGKD
jgi:hypothetical protein